MSVPEDWFDPEVGAAALDAPKKGAAGLKDKLKKKEAKAAAPQEPPAPAEEPARQEEPEKSAEPAPTQASPRAATQLDPADSPDAGVDADDPWLAGFEAAQN